MESICRVWLFRDKDLNGCGRLGIVATVSVNEVAALYTLFSKVSNTLVQVRSCEDPGSLPPRICFLLLR